MRPVIAVVGHGKNAGPIHIKLAYEIGRSIAKKGGVLLCGGKAEGVMGAAAKGASEQGGIAVGILPESDKSKTSKFLTVPILTGMGFARNQILGFSCDAMIVVGGGVGTLTEVAYAYACKKPIIYLKPVNGLLKQFSGKYMDEKKAVKILEANGPEEAVEMAFKLANK